MVIPDGTRMIKEGQFKEMAIESVKIPASVKLIGGRAFYKCTKLKSVELPEGLE